jgi:large subunit ribosomal protein L23
MAEEKKLEAEAVETPAEETKPAKKAAAKKAPAKKAAAKKTAKKEEAVEYVTRPAIIKDFSIVKYVIVTEETQKLQATDNAMVFAVAKKATKLEIKAAIQAIFNAKVKSVNTRNVLPKTRRVGRYSGKLPAYKRAIVRFDSSFDLGKITAAVANEERAANEEAE